MKKIFFVIFLFLPVIAMDQEQEDGPDCCYIMKIVVLGFLRQLHAPHAPLLYPLQRLPKYKKRTRSSEKED